MDEDLKAAATASDRGRGDARRYAQTTGTIPSKIRLHEGVAVDIREYAVGWNTFVQTALDGAVAAIEDGRVVSWEI